MDLNTSKNLGGIGALLMFIGILPFIDIYGIIPFVGLILLMIGTYGIANYYKEAGIFNNALYGVITVIIGGVIAAVLAFVAFVNIFTEVGLTWSNVNDWRNMISQISTTEWRDAIFRNAGYIIGTLAVVFIFLVIAAVLLRKSMVLAANKTGVGLFNTAGMVLLIGAILTIVVFGFILLWICLLLIAIAFFQIKVQPAQQMSMPPPETAPPP